MRQDKFDNMMYVVLDSPLDELGQPEFSPGAKFSRDNLLATLSMGYFPAGLILKNKMGIYQVAGKKLLRIDKDK